MLTFHSIEQAREAVERAGLEFVDATETITPHQVMGNVMGNGKVVPVGREVFLVARRPLSDGGPGAPAGASSSGWRRALEGLR